MSHPQCQKIIQLPWTNLNEASPCSEWIQDLSRVCIFTPSPITVILLHSWAPLRESVIKLNASACSGLEGRRAALSLTGCWDLFLAAQTFGCCSSRISQTARKLIWAFWELLSCSWFTLSSCLTPQEYGAPWPPGRQRKPACSSSPGWLAQHPLQLAPAELPESQLPSHPALHGSLQGSPREKKSHYFVAKSIVFQTVPTLWSEFSATNCAGNIFWLR